MSCLCGRSLGVPVSYWEARGRSDDWYTPKYIFDALGCRFNMDVAGVPGGRGTHVPAKHFLFADGLTTTWRGFVWMNPPFGGRNGLEPWLAKFIEHGNGIALTPDRTSAPWFQTYAPKADALLFMPKVRFLRPDGTEGKSPSNGTTLWAAGALGHAALIRASGLGFLVTPGGYS